jgi:carbamoyl-phosphate synthase small subunit
MPTALLVLADGTVLEGFGFGATGHAVGEVCFNTAMTGYEEILTDPSYAGQIITFTFPHIGNVGTNEEDIETVNMAATPGARGVVLQTAISAPSSYRSKLNLEQWLERRGIIGLCGIDTRALTSLIRSKGMPNAVIAHEPTGRFDLDALKQEAREWPGLVGMDLVPMVTSAQRFSWDETPWQWEKGYGRQDAAQFHVVAIDYGIKRNILRQLAGKGCKVTVVPATTSADDIARSSPTASFSPTARRPGRDRRICGAGDPQHHRAGHPDLRHLPRPPDARHRGRRQDHEDAPGSPRRQPSGEGPRHRQGRDHLDEPRLRGRPRDPAGERDRDACRRCSTARTAALRSRTSRCSRCSTIPEASPGPRDSHYLFERFVEMMRQNKRA